jgi:hypothetical protein
MLISHKYKFIFLKTEKSASSSLYKVFEKIISESDKLYQANPRTKRSLLRELGVLEDCSFESCSNVQSKGLMRIFPQIYGIHSHGSAKDVRNFLGQDLFERYTVITSERNPWDRQVSLFAHRVDKYEDISISDFDRCMRSYWYNLMHHNRLHNWDIYSIDNKMCADKIIRFEHLHNDLSEVLGFLWVDPERYALPHLRGEYRKEQRSYRDLYTDKSRELVRKWYSREIDYFGYEF